LINIGTVKLGEEPTLILVPSWENLEEELSRARALGIRLVEARIDLLSDKSSASIRKALDKISDYGFFAVSTVRPVWEGGAFKGDEEERLSIFKEVIKHPATGAVDVELRSRIKESVKELAREEGKRLILSYHDFEKLPEEPELEQILDQMRSFSPDIIKLAFMARSDEDVPRLCCKMAAEELPRIFMLMGEKGRLSRVIGFSFGSLLSYTFFGRAVAPGQIGAEELVSLLTKLYPELGKKWKAKSF